VKEEEATGDDLHHNKKANFRDFSIAQVAVSYKNPPGIN
jgi:hypothetical protein